MMVVRCVTLTGIAQIQNLIHILPGILFAYGQISLQVERSGMIIGVVRVGL